MLIRYASLSGISVVPSITQNVPALIHIAKPESLRICLPWLSCVCACIRASSMDYDCIFFSIGSDFLCFRVNMETKSHAQHHPHTSVKPGEYNRRWTCMNCLLQKSSSGSIDPAVSLDMAKLPETMSGNHVVTGLQLCSGKPGCSPGRPCLFLPGSKSCAGDFLSII